MSSTLIASWVSVGVIALRLGQVETLVLAEVPCMLGSTIDIARSVAYGIASNILAVPYCIASMVEQVVKQSSENSAQFCVYNFDSMIRMVNHMRLKLNTAYNVDMVCVRVFFFVLFHLS